MQQGPKSAMTLDDLVIHLLHRAVQRADDTFDDLVDEHGLTPRQFAVLLSISQVDNPSQTDIVQITGIDRSTTTEMVRRLAKKGLLQRRRSRKDTRAYVIRLTDLGERILKAAKPKVQRADAALLAGLNIEQCRALVEALKIVSAR